MKGMMLDTMNDRGLTTHLMEIANDEALRQVVYEHLGEFCHQFRNRLNSLKLCLYLAKRQSCTSRLADFCVLETHYARLERSVEMLQTLCRPITIAPSLLGLDLLIDDRRPGWARRAAESEVEVEICPPDVRAVVRFDPDRMGQALDVLVGWRLALLGPGSSAILSWRADRGKAQVSWQEETNAFDAASFPGDPSHAWALPLITRIADAHGGAARIHAGERWRLDLEWPTGPDCPAPRAVH